MAPSLTLVTLVKQTELNGGLYPNIFANQAMPDWLCVMVHVDFIVLLIIGTY